jgi:Leucine Rich repeat
VQASVRTLQKLELTNNNWELTSPESLHEWELFLSSFKDCQKLRKVDFSHNKLGDKGIETLVRVYTRDLQASLWEDQDSDHSFDEFLTHSLSGISTIPSDDEEDEISSLAETSVEYLGLAPSAMIKPRRRQEEWKRLSGRGFPYIAYIQVEDVGMTDLGALHLTYLLPFHQLPHVLLGRLDSQVVDITEGREDEIYDKWRLTRGVVYDIDSAELSSLAKKILESAEKLRRAGGLTPMPVTLAMGSTAHGAGSPPPSPDSLRARRNSDSARSMTYFPETPSPSRKDSVSSIRTVSSIHNRAGSFVSPGKSEISVCWMDTVKTRTKLQGEILKLAGTVHVCQLWTAAIKLLSLGRIVMLRESRAGTNGMREYRPTLPPSPLSPGTPKTSRIQRAECLGGLDVNLWLRILVPIADPQRVLSDGQITSVIDWAADRGTLLKEGEWAGKLPHVQMWKLLDVPPVRRQI